MEIISPRHLLPAAVQQRVAAAYHAALKKAGDENPDFLAAVRDLTASACLAFNQEVLGLPGDFRLISPIVL